MKRCMIYACNHAWSDIADGELAHYGFECLRCGDYWDFDDCDHEPAVKGCECAR